MNERRVTTRYSFINYARLVAILLITNSHFDGVYPWPISCGGAPGVALFFMITGFLLTRGPKNLEPIELWYFKRLKRIYPSTWITTAILCLMGHIVIDNYKRALELFIYPTGFWFIAAILELYLLFYLITKGKVSYRTVLIFEIVWYLFRYIRGYENTFFVELSLRVSAGFIAMLVGGLWKQKINESASIIKFKNKWINLLIAVLSLGGFLIVKFLLSKNVLFKLQFLTHAFSIVFAYFLLAFMCDVESKFKLLDQKLIGRVLVGISACSLEIYMIQRWIIEKLEGIVFPINLLLIMIAVPISGFVVHFVSTTIVDCVEKITKKK